MHYSDYDIKKSSKDSELLDRFAEKAMAELIRGMHRLGYNAISSQEIADLAYEIARAMLRAREAK